MILQIHVTEEQLVSWLHELGYQTTMKEVTEFESTYHNKCKERTFNRPHLTLNGMYITAERFAEMYLHDMITDESIKTIK